MLKLYGSVVSRAFRALWTLEELEVAFEHVNVDLMKGEHRRQEYLALNPNGKVPCLVDGDFVLWESAAICRYLAVTYPDKGLLPTSAADQARVDQWNSFVISELEQPLWVMGKHTFALPEKLRVPEVIATAKKEWERPAAVLAEAVSGRDYLVGDAFSIADIMAVHTLNWARSVKMPLGHDALEIYRKQHVARPGFKRVLARMK